MLARCIANTGKDLSEKSIETGQLRSTQYMVDIGESYTVYSMSTWKGRLDYLLSKEDIKPFWHPAELFEVVDPLLPLEWYFSFRRNYERDHVRMAIWGYKEMVFDPSHLVDLIEREPEALSIFLKRKRELDEYQDLSKFMHKK